MHTKLKLLALLLGSTLLLSGCNTTEPLTGELDALEQRIAELEVELEQATRERDRYRSERSAYDQRIQDLSGELTHSRSRNTELQASLDVTRDEFQRARTDWQRQLDEFQNQARSLTLQNSDVSAERTEDGDIRLSVPSEVLFQPGSEVIGSRGARALDEVQRILNEEFPAHRIEIAGHTDSDPILKSRKRFNSNMNLSLMRANAVYSYLAKKGVTDIARVRASGYGEFRPKVANDTKENKRKNRRVEVIVFAN